MAFARAKHRFARFAGIEPKAPENYHPHRKKPTKVSARSECGPGKTDPHCSDQGRRRARTERTHQFLMTILGDGGVVCRAALANQTKKNPHWGLTKSGFGSTIGLERSPICLDPSSWGRGLFFVGSAFPSGTPSPDASPPPRPRSDGVNRPVPAIPRPSVRSSGGSSGSRFSPESDADTVALRGPFGSENELPLALTSPNCSPKDGGSGGEVRSRRDAATPTTVFGIASRNERASPPELLRDMRLPWGVGFEGFPFPVVPGTLRPSRRGRSRLGKELLRRTPYLRRVA
jgi:hypothetical protein